MCKHYIFTGNKRRESFAEFAQRANYSRYLSGGGRLKTCRRRVFSPNPCGRAAASILIYTVLPQTRSGRKPFRQEIISCAFGNIKIITTSKLVV